MTRSASPIAHPVVRRRIARTKDTVLRHSGSGKRPLPSKYPSTTYGLSGASGGTSRGSTFHCDRERPATRSSLAWSHVASGGGDLRRRLQGDVRRRVRARRAIHYGGTLLRTLRCLQDPTGTTPR